MRRCEPRRAALACALLAACSSSANNAAVQPSAKFVDVSYPVQRGDAPGPYSYAIDRSGTLWYLQGNRIVHETEPGRRTTLQLDAARGGKLFWYEGAIWALAGDGSQFLRIDKDAAGASMPVPGALVPVVGVSVDARRRGIVAAQTAPNRLAVVDVWKWYGEGLPGGIAPFAAALAGGPHGKRFLVVGDKSDPFVVVKNRAKAQFAFVHVPSNQCFAGTDAALPFPVDAMGRDERRVWVTSGPHLASIDLIAKRVLRVWDLDGCATHLVWADANSAIVETATQPAKGTFESSLVRVDRDGTHPLAQYGTVDGLARALLLDGYGRLWWYDENTGAFVCRTPLQ